MPYSVAVVVWRKSGISPAEFKKHYEEIHIPMARSLAGSTWPLTHTRHYIQRNVGETAGSDQSNAAYPAAVLMGDATDFGYDVWAELVFENEAKFQEFFGAMAAPEVAIKLATDEERFLDRSKLKVVHIGESLVTARS